MSFDMEGFQKDWNELVKKRNIEKPWLNKTDEEKESDAHYVTLLEEIERGKKFRKDMLEELSRLLEDTKVLSSKGFEPQREPLLTLIQLACGYVIKDLDRRKLIDEDVVAIAVKAIRESLTEYKLFTDLKVGNSLLKLPLLRAINNKHSNLKYEIDRRFTELRSEIENIIENKEC